MSGDLTAGRLPAGRSERWASLCADLASSALIRAAPSHSACPASGAQLDNCCVSAVTRASQRPPSKSVFRNSSVALNTREWLKSAIGAEAGSPGSGHMTPSPALPQRPGVRAPSRNLGRVTEPAEPLCFTGSRVCAHFPSGLQRLNRRGIQSPGKCHNWSLRQWTLQCRPW